MKPTAQVNKMKRTTQVNKIQRTTQAMIFPEPPRFEEKLPTLCVENVLQAPLQIRAERSLSETTQTSVDPIVIPKRPVKLAKCQGQVRERGPQYLSLNEYAIIKAIAKAVESIAGLGKCSRSKMFSFFGKSQRLKMSLEDYLIQLCNFIMVWNDVKVNGVRPAIRILVMAMLYIDRSEENSPDFVISSSNIHRLCLSAMSLAMKSSEDSGCGNRRWAAIGGMQMGELSEGEGELCKLVSWHLHIGRKEFERTIGMFRKYCTF